MSWIPDHLPEDIEAERSLLATLCTPGSELDAEPLVLELSEADFVHPQHKALLKALRDVLDRRSEVNPFTLRDSLEQAGDLGRMGGFPGLMELLKAEEVGRPRVLVDILARKRKLRQLLRMGAHLVGQACEEEDPEALIEGLCASLAGMTQRPGDPGLVAVGELTDDVLAQVMEEASGSSSFGIRTGFYRFDGITRGFKPGDLIVLAARPGIGKTTLALNWALRAAGRSTVLVFSLEMSRQEVTRKLLTDMAGLDLRNLNPRDPRHMAALHTAKCELDALPLAIDDRAGINVRQIRAKVERAQARQQVGLVVVDYLQIVSSVQASKNQSETHRIGEISRELKLLAKDCRVPVVVLSQLNREVEKRANGRPQLSDLRDSGAIEQDADLVAFVHRKILAGVDQEHQDKTAELFVAKHRNGPCGSVPLKWFGELSRYEEETRETGDRLAEEQELALEDGV